MFRLRKFSFRTLKKPPVAGVQEFLKSHAMDCIVWASSVAKTPDDELPPPVPGTASEDDFPRRKREGINPKRKH